MGFNSAFKGLKR